MSHEVSYAAYTLYHFKLYHLILADYRGKYTYILSFSVTLHELLADIHPDNC